MAQCKTKAELHREYGRACDMCNENGSALKSWSCVKYLDVQFEGEPEFDKAPSDYMFALAIVEGKPVFPGDLLYEKETGKPYAVSFNKKCGYEYLTWIPPKTKTIMINGYKVPEPERVAPPRLTIYYLPTAVNDHGYTVNNWLNHEEDFKALENGVVHLIPENAATHGKSIYSFTRVQPELANVSFIK